MRDCVEHVSDKAPHFFAHGFRKVYVRKHEREPARAHIERRALLCKNLTPRPVSYAVSPRKLPRRASEMRIRIRGIMSGLSACGEAANRVTSTRSPNFCVASLEIANGLRIILDVRLFKQDLVLEIRI